MRYMHSSRSVSPIHFFDQFGNSMLNYQQLVEDNKRLTEENQRLRRALDAAARQNTQASAIKAPSRA